LTTYSDHITYATAGVADCLATPDDSGVRHGAVTRV